MTDAGSLAGNVTRSGRVPLIAELIRKKRDGRALDPDEISQLVSGIADGTVTDAQIAAFAMAVWFRGMDLAEQSALTIAIRDSGRVLHWRDMNGPLLDKHSTGGVGDLVSLVLGPLLAAAGAFVPKISGRGLGHTGGTLDKLESIPGLTTSLEPDRFQRQVREIGFGIIGQSEQLAPADRRMYAVRDVTATISAPPLIVSSILSKKLAEGLDALLIDIKVGNGAFMADEAQACQLAETLCGVARASGLRCNALLTGMDQPIAWSAGNALEVAEALDFLTGCRRHPHLYEIVLALAVELLVLGGVEADAPKARNVVRSLLDSGAAAEKFAAMVRWQGGPADIIARGRALLPQAPVIQPVTAGRAGRIGAVDVRSLGVAVVQLGGGRLRVGDTIDPSVGLSNLCMLGATVEADTPVCQIHAATQEGYEFAARTVRKAYRVVDPERPVGVSTLVRARIEGQSEQ